jgi:mRNA deadenylase 3'-5' endonuclease subunit Ccr4
LYCPTLVLQAKQYSSWLYREVPLTYLDWRNRREAIAAELCHWLPDVVCLQEVDRYQDLADRLKPLG